MMRIKEIVKETLHTFGKEGDYISTKLGEIFLISILVGTGLNLLGLMSFETVSVFMTVMSIIMAIVFALLVWAYSGVKISAEERTRIQKIIDILLGGMIWASLVFLITISTLKSERILMKLLGSFLVMLVVFLPFITTWHQQDTNRNE